MRLVNETDTPSAETFKRSIAKGWATKIYIVAVGALCLPICAIIFVWLTKGFDNIKVFPSTLLVGIGTTMLFFNYLHYIVVTNDHLIFCNSVFPSRKMKLEWNNIREITFYYPPRWSTAYARVLLKDRQRPFMVCLDTVPPESYERFVQICQARGVAIKTPRREKWLRRHPELRH